jgi:hypothetical protein
MHRSAAASLLLVVTLLLASIAGAAPLSLQGDAKAPEKVIPAALAREHVGRECTAEMKVQSSKNAAKRRTYFLDSETDFHNEKNLSVVISYDHADKFREAGIDDPAEHYKGKTIRVTGKVIEEDDQVRIRVEDPKQITVVEPK